MIGLQLNTIDSNYPSYYIVYEDGSILNTKTGHQLKMDSDYRYCLKYADRKGTIHRSIRTIYLKLFGKAYHGKDSITNLPNEEWKEVEGTKETYYVSNYARVKSYNKHVEARLLQPYFKRKDKTYLTVEIFGQGYQLSRLVAKHFLPDEYSESKVVHHKDGNPMNNHVSNLVCLTQEQHVKLHNDIARNGHQR